MHTKDIFILQLNQKLDKMREKPILVASIVQLPAKTSISQEKSQKLELVYLAAQ